MPRLLVRAEVELRGPPARRVAIERHLPSLDLVVEALDGDAVNLRLVHRLPAEFALDMSFEHLEPTLHGCRSWLWWSEQGRLDRGLVGSKALRDNPNLSGRQCGVSFV